jgi:hypothetical protein
VDMDQVDADMFKQVLVIMLHESATEKQKKKVFVEKR